MNKNNFLKNFIKSNHNMVIEYYNCYFDRYLIKNNWKEQLRVLFISSYNSGPQSNISNMSAAILEFEKILEKMKHFSYSELLNATQCENYSQLFDLFKSKKFKGIGEKKAALFLKEILYFKNRNIITDIPNKLEKDLYVPVDRVIIRTIHSLNYQINNKNLFKSINDLAKEIFPDEPILLEDLWFWGRFYRCRPDDKSNKIPYCKFNDKLVIIDINITPEYRKKLLEYGKRNLNCPFFQKCENKNKKYCV